MDPNAASEELPALYRAILDRVGQLEACGDRATANKVRAAATRIYSKSWDERAKRRLEDLLRKHTAEPAGQHAAGRGFWRRTIRAT